MNTTNKKLILAVRRLVAGGMSPRDAFLACEDFLERYGERDFEAFLRAMEARHVA